MIRLTCVLAGVPVRRRVAAQGRPAALARAKMNPPISGLHALVALAVPRGLDLAYAVDVAAGVWHNPEAITHARGQAQLCSLARRKQ